MNLQEILEKWLMVDRDTTPMWRLPIGEIEYESSDDPTDGVEIAALAENIRQCGLISPILVTKQKNGKKYRLISGRRRLEAVTLLGRTHISAIVAKSDDIASLKISLSENIMRKEPHYLDQTSALQALLEITSIEEIARLFSVKQEYLKQKLELNILSPYEKRLIRLIRLTEQDAHELCKIENTTMRKLILEKIAESGESCNRSALISQAASSSDFRLTQSEKIFVSDIRVFLNTVERAAEMMSSAGFATLIDRKDELDSYEFTIRVSKEKHKALRLTSKSIENQVLSAASHVSRETMEQNSPTQSIEKTDVSRETSENSAQSIDETVKA